MRTKVGHGWPNDVRKKDLEITYFNAQKSGGQNVNKNQTAVRIKHIPTNLVVECQTYKSQAHNKKEAWKRLCNKLVPIMKKEAEVKRIKVQTETIRTYSEKDDRVSDKRIPNKTWSYRQVLHKSGLKHLLDTLATEGDNYE